MGPEKRRERNNEFRNFSTLTCLRVKLPNPRPAIKRLTTMGKTKILEPIERLQIRIHKSSKLKVTIPELSASSDKTLELSVGIVVAV